jgi:leucyl aminopeptidase (aminopeptidase T)
MKSYYVSDTFGWVVVRAKNAKNARRVAMRRFSLSPEICCPATKKEVEDYRRVQKKDGCPW